MNQLLTVTSSESAQHNHVEMDRVMFELDHLKRQSRRLDLMNQLHGRMAGILSITGMIEAYSVWMMPMIEHELIGYNNNTKQKQHLFCSGHGPGRRKAIAFAEAIIDNNEMCNGSMVCSEDGHHAHKWIFETVDDAGILLILKQGRELNDDELEIINASLEVLADCLQRGLQYEDLFERASNDALTGLHNRRVFEERIFGIIDSSVRYNKPVTMVAMDLDRFKQINDKLGHLAGDEALKSVAKVFKKAVRSSDLLVRMGGDEFLAILDNTDKEKARHLAERLCAGVEALDIRACKDVKLGVSIGIAELQEGEKLCDWMDRADDILYHAKAQGRSRVAVK
ncbi:GGDEF domain-containing protein [Desulfosediminicola flagellatus]|uniref:GGDEF domain-containing protein n=1 Tax=Desulfosediminicola flagellatus TaxID=2569541 RepID=UPI0010ABF846|nr:GGDEF domain-containing protein [Desulfosediminicola flagellatus]